MVTDVTRSGSPPHVRPAPSSPGIQTGIAIVRTAGVPGIPTAAVPGIEADTSGIRCIVERSTPAPIGSAGIGIERPARQAGGSARCHDRNQAPAAHQADYPGPVGKAKSCVPPSNQSPAESVTVSQEKQFFGAETERPEPSPPQLGRIQRSSRPSDKRHFGSIWRRPWKSLRNGE
jgi:hypothetical protein